MRNLQKYLFPLVLVATAAYCNIFSFEFLYDDEFLIQKNQFLNSFRFLPEIFSSSSTAGAGFLDSFYRPLQIFFYLLTNQLFEKEPPFFHGLNLLFHICNSILIFNLGLRLQLSHLTAMIAALLWVVHPLHVEAVTYMSATADSLHVFFILLGLTLLMPKASIQRILISLVCFAAALLSKESGLVFPALLMTLIFFFSENPRKLKPYLASLPFWFLAFGYLALRQTALNFNQDFQMYKHGNIYADHILIRLQTFFSTLPSYLSLLIWPDYLSIDRNFPMATSWAQLDVSLGLGFVFLALFIVALSFRKPFSKPLRWTAWIFLWFGCAYFPQSGILIPTNSFFLEHWMYLPSISLSFAIGKIFDELKDTKPFAQKALLGTIVCAIAALGLRTWLQNKVWQSPISLFSHILERNPDNPRVLHNLAMAYDNTGNSEFALNTYKKVLSLTTSYPQTYHNIGRIYLARKEWDFAETSFKKAIELSPRFHPSYASLIELYQNKGDHQKATEYLELYKKIFPDIISTH